MGRISKVENEQNISQLIKKFNAVFDQIQELILDHKPDLETQRLLEGLLSVMENYLKEKCNRGN